MVRLMLVSGNGLRWGPSSEMTRLHTSDHRRLTDILDETARAYMTSQDKYSVSTMTSKKYNFYRYI